MAHSFKQTALLWSTLAFAALTCFARELEPPFTWEGDGEAALISENGSREFTFQFTLSVDAQGKVSGASSTDEGSSTIKHVFYSDKQEYGFSGYFTRKIIIVLMMNEESGTPIMSIVNGRILLDKLLYGELLLARYEAGSDVADALGVDRPEATLLKDGEPPEALHSALDTCIPLGCAKIVGGYTHTDSKTAGTGEQVPESKKEAPKTALRGSYYANGKIYVNTYGTPEGRPVTVPPVPGQEDFKPSWSKTGDMLVFFRRVKNDPNVVNWKTVLCVIKTDGTGFQALTDDKHTNFNPTWTRDGTNRPIWNRKNPDTGGFFVCWSKVGNKPGREEAVSDKRYHTWIHTCLTDGRILVESMHPKHGWGYYLMTPKPGKRSKFERIDCAGMDALGLLCRISLFPSEKKICFGHLLGHKFRETAHAICIADFDVKKRTISDVKVIANNERKEHWYAYPRWTKDESAVVYHANSTGKGALFLYTLKDGTTQRVSTDANVDYRYPHGEAAPK